jgi:hypothetical protein
MTRPVLANRYALTSRLLAKLMNLGELGSIYAPGNHTYMGVTTPGGKIRGSTLGAKIVLGLISSGCSVCVSFVDLL